MKRNVLILVALILSGPTFASFTTVMPAELLLAAADLAQIADDVLERSNTCAGRNRFGAFAEGGGCNRHGCWPAGGFCNAHGCSLSGACTAEGCLSKIESHRCSVRIKSDSDGV